MRIKIRALLSPDDSRTMDEIANYVIVPIDAEQVTPAYGVALKLINGKWRGALLWVAWHIDPTIDTTRSPFQKRWVKNSQSWGDFLYYWLVLVRFCWEYSPRFRKKFPDNSATDIWKIAMLELKQIDIDSAQIQTHKPKTEHRNFFKTLRTELAQGTRYDYVRGAITLNHILDTAQKLRKQGSKRQRERFYNSAWNPFIGSIALHEKLQNVDIASFSDDGNTLKLTSPQRGQPKQTRLQMQNPIHYPPDLKFSFTVLYDDGGDEIKTMMYGITDSWSNYDVYKKIH